MIVSFADNQLEELYSLPLKKTGKYKYPQEVIKSYKKKIDFLKAAPDLKIIASFKGLNYEKLKEKKYEDCHSIRVNDKYRIIFTVSSENEVSVRIVELSNHYA